MNKIPVFAFGCLLGLIIGGCEGLSSKQRDNQITSQELSEQVKQLQQQLAQSQQHNARLAEQLENLLGFSQQRQQQLVHVYKIKFGRYTAPFDNENDGLDDGVTVYLQLLDQSGDKIKAAGEVELELWDLAEAEGKRRLGQWRYGLQEMPDYWRGRLLSYHYKFKLPWQAGYEPRRSNITLICRFVDALTGKAFEVQKLIAVSVSP